MNDINEMPPKCQYCPYWEVCEYPWVCPDREQLATNLQQTCNQLATDTISRQMAIDAFRKRLCSSETESGYWISFSGVERTLKSLPSAHPERKRGQWKMLQMPISPPVYKCSVCGSHALQSVTGCLMNRHYEANLTNYCPNCGADMMEMDDESN